MEEQLNAVYLALLILIQLVVGSLWLKLITKMDRNRKKKNTEAVFPQLFAFGMLSAGIAVAIYRILPPWLGISGSYLIDNFLTNLIMVGPVEELCKFVVFYLTVSRLDSIRESTDGLLQGATVGLAFALVENISYAWWYGPEVIPFRSVFNVAGHMSYGALWGMLYAVLTMSGSEQKAPFKTSLLVVVPAGVVHGLYNHLLLYGVGYGLMIKGIVIIAILAVYQVSVRRSPFRDFDPQLHKTAIPSILLALNAHPDDSKLNYRLMLYATYAGKLELAADSAAACLLKHRQSPILRAWYSIIDILRGEESTGFEGLDAALTAASDKQKTILLGSVQQVIRDASLKYRISNRIFGKPGMPWDLRTDTRRSGKTSPGY